jgi:hypothetical protein
MTAETNTQPKPKVKEPQRPPPVVESVTGRYGWEIGRSVSSAGGSPPSQDSGQLNSTTAVFTNIVMRQMAEGEQVHMPKERTRRPLRQAMVMYIQQQQGNTAVNIVVQRFATHNTITLNLGRD